MIQGSDKYAKFERDTYDIDFKFLSQRKLKDLEEVYQINIQ